MRRACLLLLPLLTLVVVAWVWHNLAAAPVAALEPPDGPAASQAAAAGTPTGSFSPLRFPPAAAPGPGAGFASFDEDGQPIADPVRNGLVLWLSTSRGVPVADLPVTAHWRKGFGLYGKDVGHTDARGRFATTVAAVEQLEGVEVRDPTLGELGFWEELLPLAEDPRTVHLIVPQLAPLRVRSVDERGTAVAAAKVTANAGTGGSVARRYLLRGPLREIVGDASGIAEMSVPTGAYELSVEAPGCELPQRVWVQVEPEGAHATVVLLRSEQAVAVRVRVTVPPGHRAPVQIVGFSTAAPARAELPGQAGEIVQRSLPVTRVDALTFEVRTHALPWRCIARSDGCETAAVDAAPTQTDVHLALAAAAPPSPKARLNVKVLLPNGEPTFADVRVHETPDLVHGSDRSAVGGELELELVPGKRICLSASRHGYARCVAGPFDLEPGEREITLQLLPTQSISGRIVDAAGRGLAAQVMLHRPAGALRGLADGVPEILDTAPTSDGLDIQDGEFWFHGCGPGEHEVWLFPREGLPAKKRVSPGVPVTVVAGEGIADLQVVEGTVRDAATQRPVDGVELDAAGAFVYLDPRSDANGRFRFVARRGELRIRAVRRGYAVFDVPPIAVGASPVVCDVQLPPSPVRFLRVVDGRGRPVPGAKLSVLGGDGEPIELLDQHGYQDGITQTTNGAGRVDLRGAAAGALRVRVTMGARQAVLAVPSHGGMDAVFDLRLAD